MLDARKRRVRELQFCTEASAQFATIRDGPVPYGPGRFPYATLRALDPWVIQENKQLIYERVVGYLSVLAARGIYLRGDLTDQVLVFLEGHGKAREIKSIQLMPNQFSPTEQDLSQLKALADFLGYEIDLGLSKFQQDVFFPEAIMTVSAARTERDFIRSLATIDDIDLLNDQQCIFYCGGKLVSTQQIFEHRRDAFQFEENGLELWLILSRFCNECTCVQQLYILPAWLDRFVRYETPDLLPECFTHLVNSADPLARLRIALGIYPKDIRMLPFDVEVDTRLQAVMDNLPTWYRERLRQILYISAGIRDETEQGESKPYIGMGFPKSAEEFVERFQPFE